MTRDLETLRQKLQDHRDVLLELESDSPSAALAQRYAALRSWVEMTLRNLDSAPPDVESPAPTTAPAAAIPRSDAAEPELVRDPAPYPQQAPESDSRRGEGARLAAVLLLGLAAIALLGWLFVRFLSDRPESSAASDERPVLEGLPSETTPAEEAVIIEEEPPPVPVARPVEPSPRQTPATRSPATSSGARDGAVSVDPPAASVSGIGSGRVIRQFRLHNSAASPVRISVERSSCRCLWYDVSPEIPSNDSVVLAVTVDGTRMEADQLDETIRILSASDNRTLAQFRLTGTR